MKQLLTIIMLLISLGIIAQDNNSIKIGQPTHVKNPFHWAVGNTIGPVFSEDGGSQLFNGLGLSVLQNNYIFEVEIRTYLFSDQGCSSPDENRAFIGHSIGRFQDVNKMRFSMQVGMASLSGTKRENQINQRDSWLFCDHITEYRTVDYHVVNYTVKVGAKCMPTPHFSIGIDLEANFNSFENLMMPMLTFQCGNIRALLNKE